jgi:two-component system phosphate regulon sensor histidine kinase PhoR
MPARTWKFHAGRLALGAAVVLTIGWWIGEVLLLAGLAVAAFAAWQLANLWRIYQWLQNPVAPIPSGNGAWRDVFESVEALQQRNEKQRERFRVMIGEFRSLTDAFPDATLVIDENETLTWLNSGAKSLLGLKSPEDLGQQVTNLLRGPDFADWLAVQSEVSSPLEMPSPRDERSWLLVNAVPFGEKQRLIILRDNSEVRNVEKIRRDFIANISHELRTPLTVLQGYLETFETHGVNDVGDAVSRMLTQTGQMQALLDDLLELSRLQNEEFGDREEIVNVPAMLAQLKEQAEELSRGRHELSFSVDDSLCLTGMASDLESAFRNLISNAVKYTPKRGKINVSWHADPKGPQLRVSDSGIGIPREHIPRLTERFYRVGSDRARKTGGSGLGLAIVKHVINAHQAELNIESEFGEGSTFTCTFPPDRQRELET